MHSSQKNFEQLGQIWAILAFDEQSMQVNMLNSDIFYSIVFLLLEVGEF